MTGVRELVQIRVIPAAPEQVRLSMLGGRTQLDVSLPLDAPIASLVPELVKLVRSRDTATEQPEDSSTKDAKRNFWELRRADDDEPLSPDATLREAGVTSGALLRLSAERALSTPTLYDDVVDAAARLNRAAFAGWDATAALWVAFVGVHLASLVWVYFLLAEVFRPHRPVLVGVAIVIALALVGAAALAERSYGLSLVGAALGWAAIPIAAGVTWALLSGFGGYVHAAGCAAMILVLFGFHRIVGVGHWAYLAGGVFFGLAGVALVIHEVGVRADWVGCGLAVIAILASQAVPRLTAPLGRFKTPSVPVEPAREDTMFENPFEAAPPVHANGDADDPRDATPTAEGVWERVRSATITRSAAYAGLAVSAVVGVVVVLRSQTPLQWSGVTFAVACAASLALSTRRPASGIERASLGTPTFALAAVICWSAERGDQPIPAVTFGLLLLAALASAAIGARAGDHVSPRLSAVLSYLDYLASVALIPLALWVAGLYVRLGI